MFYGYKYYNKTFYDGIFEKYRTILENLLGLQFKGISKIDIASDFSIDIISIYNRMLKNTEYELIVNNRLQSDNIKGLNEWKPEVSRTLKTAENEKTKYIQNKKGNLILRLYNKSKEIKDNDDKKTYILDYCGFEKIFRMEISCKTHSIFLNACKKLGMAEIDVWKDLNKTNTLNLLLNELSNKLIRYRKNKHVFSLLDIFLMYRKKNRQSINMSSKRDKQEMTGSLLTQSHSLRQNDIFKEFILEMKRCEFDIKQTGTLDDFEYNGIKYSDGIETYTSKLKALYNSFEEEIYDCTDNIKLGEIKLLIKDIWDTYFYDIPTKEAAIALIEDGSNNNNSELIRQGKIFSFINDMVSTQLYFISKSLTILNTSLGIQEDIIRNADFNVIVEQLKENARQNEREVKEQQPTVRQSYKTLEPICPHIKGVKALASYLGIGINKAQAIVNSKILIEYGIQTQIGNSLIFEQDKLKNLMKENPYIFKDIRTHLKKKL